LPSLLGLRVNHQIPAHHFPVHLLSILLHPYGLELQEVDVVGELWVGE
jgi:hypothetical protein